MTVLHISVQIFGRTVRIADKSQITPLPAGSILIIPPPDGGAGHVVPVEYLPNGDVRGHPAMVGA
jgi:hypothetical protein